MRSIMLIPVLTLAACDDALLFTEAQAPCSPGFVENDDGACLFDEAELQEVMRTFDDGRLVKVNTHPFLQYLGPELERNVWVSPTRVPNTALTAVDLYLQVRPEGNDPLDFDFPVGTVIVHETIDRSEGHTVQVKLADHDDGTGRPWFTGKYYDDGLPDLNDCNPCTSCHNDSSRPDSEGLWGIPDEAL